MSSACVWTQHPKLEGVFAQNLPRLITKAAINWVKQQPVTKRLWVERRVILKRRVNLKTRAKRTKICNCEKQKREAAQSGLTLRTPPWHLRLPGGPGQLAVLPSGWWPRVQQASRAPGVPACRLVGCCPHRLGGSVDCMEQHRYTWGCSTQVSKGEALGADRGTRHPRRVSTSLQTCTRLL